MESTLKLRERKQGPLSLINFTGALYLETKLSKTALTTAVADAFLEGTNTTHLLNILLPIYI